MNYINGTWGKPEIIDGLKEQTITVEEAAAALTTQAGELGGFWDDVADRACREGKRMTDIDPGLFPSSRGPRDL
jgi:hypothetical protein